MNVLLMPKFQIGAGFAVTAIVVAMQVLPWIPKFSTQAQVSTTAVRTSTPRPTSPIREVSGVENPGKLQRLIIPELSVGLPIVSKPMKNGTWAVEEGVANYAEGSSPFNGDIGNSVLYGHNKTDAFKPLHSVKVGDSIHVQTNRYQFEYEVYEIDSVVPKNVDVLKPGTEKQLTLITCDGMFDQKRLVVKARLTHLKALN